MATKKAEAPKEEDPGEMELHVPPDLEYPYRDIFSVSVSMDEVIVEFGNRDRSSPRRGSISDRVVLSVGNAFRLQSLLGQSLAKARQHVAEVKALKNAEGERAVKSVKSVK
jgi:hypothetical protein